MKVAEIRGLQEIEILDKVKSNKQELNRLKAQISSGTRAENPGKFKNLRKEIARMLTVVQEKKLKIDRKVKKGKVEKIETKKLEINNEEPKKIVDKKSAEKKAVEKIETKVSALKVPEKKIDAKNKDGDLSKLKSNLSSLKGGKK